MKNFRMNRKAISPIFATLILIAIAVIAGVVVYAFTAGWLGGMTQNTQAAQERLTVSGANIDATGNLHVYVQDTEQSGSVTVTGVLVKDSTGTIASLSGTSLTAATTTSGTLEIVQADGLVDISGAITGLTSGNSYTATITTEAGGQFVSPSFVAP
jgi:flagellin-like protein